MRVALFESQLQGVVPGSCYRLKVSRKPPIELRIRAEQIGPRDRVVVVDGVGFIKNRIGPGEEGLKRVWHELRQARCAPLFPIRTLKDVAGVRSGKFEMHAAASRISYLDQSGTCQLNMHTHVPF